MRARARARRGVLERRKFLGTGGALPVALPVRRGQLACEDSGGLADIEHPVVGSDHQGAVTGQIDLDPLAIVGMQPELLHDLAEQ